MSKSIKKYRKKPLTIEAQKVTEKNLAVVAKWCSGEVGFRPGQGGSIRMKVSGGKVFAVPGDYVIQGQEGDFYPCEGKRFKTLFEEVGS